MQEMRVWSLGRSPGEGNGNLLQYWLPVKSLGQRRLVCCSLWGHKKVGHDLSIEQQQIHTECNQRRSPYLAYLSGRMNASYYVWYSEGASYTVRTNWYKIFSLCLPLILENVSSLFLIIFLSFYFSLLGFVGLQFYRYLDSVLKASKLLSSSFPAASAYLPPWWDGLTRSSAHIPQRALLLQIR